MLACSGSGGTLLVLESPCWFVLLLRKDIQKFLVKTAKLLWWKRKQIQEITSGVQFERIKTFSRRKKVRVLGRKKRKTVRDNRVVNGTVTQDAVCKDRWVQQNECKLFGGPLFEKPVAGLALRRTSCANVRSGES